jgi:hypothetical protein
MMDLVEKHGGSDLAPPMPRRDDSHSLRAFTFG